MTLATIGHNGAPDPIDEALEPYGDAIEEAQHWLDGSPVENDDQLKATNDLLSQIKEAKRDLEKARKEATEPLHKAWKDENARWKPTQDDIDRIAKGLVSIQAEYKKALAKKVEEEKRKAWQAAELARQEAEQKEKQAQAGDIDAMREAAMAKQHAQAAKQAASKTQRETVKGMRTVHRHEVTDHRALLNWIAQNDRDAITAFIEQYAAKNHREKAMSGVRVWIEKEVF